MESEEIKKEPTNGNQLKDFTIQLTLPAPNAEIAKEVANKARHSLTNLDTINS